MLRVAHYLSCQHRPRGIDFRNKDYIIVHNLIGKDG